MGIGPGDVRQLTFKAREVLEECEVLVGYETYMALIESLIRPGQEVIRYGMGQEVERGRQAVSLAREGKKVALISSGDAGVYGMAGLAYELARDSHLIEIIPGVSCVNAAAAVLGAPLMQDFAVISLSDLLIPWEDIQQRLELAAQGNFVLILVNPRSQGRREQIVWARDILLRSRSATTPVGVVRNAGRPGESVVLTDLAHLLDQEIDMATTVIVGNRSTFCLEGRMVTPRGYKIREND